MGEGGGAGPGGLQENRARPGRALAPRKWWDAAAYLPGRERKGPGYLSNFGGGGVSAAGASASCVGFSVIENDTVNFAASLSVE